MIKRFYHFLRQLITCWSEDKVSTYSASLAYYTIFALTPLIIICTSIIGIAFGHDLAQQRILNYINLFIGSDGVEQIKVMIQHVNHQTRDFHAEIVSIILILVGASGIFSQIQLGLNEIWGVKNTARSGVLRFLISRLLSFILVISVALLLLASIIVSIVLHFMSNYLGVLLPFAFSTHWILNPFLSILGISVLFALIYKILPDVKLQWRQVWIGAVISALLFSGGKFILSFYLSVLHTETAYGPAGSIIIILIWVYFAAQILFIGAEITKIQSNAANGHIVTRRGALVKNK